MMEVGTMDPAAEPTPSSTIEQRDMNRNAIVSGWHRYRTSTLVWTIRIVLLTVVIAAWEFAGRLEIVNPVFVGSPSRILEEFVDGVTSDIVTVHARATVTATLVGAGLAAVAGIIFAFMLSQMPIVRRAFDPLLTALNSLPRVALAPLFLMWFGIGMTSKMALAASLTFFVTFYSTLAGIDTVDNEHVRMANTLGATRSQLFRKVILPASIPSMLAGVQLGFVYGMLGTVAGEMIAGRSGLGVMLTRQAAVFRTNAYFATLAVLVIVTVAFTTVLELVRRRLLAWQEY